MTPTGDPPLLPALSAVLAKGQMINDLRAVAHNQGYPRLDVSIKWDQIMAAAPPSLREPGREADFKDWAEGVLSSIVTDYEALQVDDTFVHYDWVAIDMVGGAAGVGAFDFDALERSPTRSVNSALKTVPILLGIQRNDLRDSRQHPVADPGPGCLGAPTTYQAHHRKTRQRQPRHQGFARPREGGVPEDSDGRPFVRGTGRLLPETRTIQLQR